MRQVAFAAMAMFAFSALIASQAECAPKYTVKYVVSEAQSLVNTAVSVEGLVTNSNMVTPQPGSQVKGEFSLQDRDGASIQVSTTYEPPPNGKWLKIVGNVGLVDGTPVLVARRQIEPLWIALAALAALALVLVTLLARKPRAGVVEVYSQPDDDAYEAGVAHTATASAPLMESQQGVPGDGSVAATAAASGEPACPSCGTALEPDARFCEQCGHVVQTASAGSPTVASGIAHATGSSPTVKIPSEPVEKPVADLVGLEGPGVDYGTRIGLRKGRQKIGRADNVEIRLADETISREHAFLWWEDGSFQIQDAASTSGTMVNGEKVDRRALQDGDEITLGQTKFVFRSLPEKAGH